MTAKRDYTHAYAGYCPTCDQPRAVTVDMGDKGTAKFVADIIKRGLRVERITIEAVRSGSFCLCNRKPKRGKQLELSPASGVVAPPSEPSNPSKT